MLDRITVLADPRLRVSVGFRRALARRLQRAAPRMGDTRGRLDTLAVRLVGDPEMTALHTRYYGEPGTTDVLSFGVDGDELGDVALGWSAVRSQAHQRGCSNLDSACVLATHGIAHLLGHDHRTRREARAMLRAEARGLRAIGITDLTRPYG
ncbi:MAG: rRNA maturation RNase YbeY [Myxococcales bacterium FL481]|nr:MAG: rRNA maturation RNase YbeY [Myxococcales bacterium FL481]